MTFTNRARRLLILRLFYLLRWPTKKQNIVVVHNPALVDVREACNFQKTTLDHHDLNDGQLNIPLCQKANLYLGSVPYFRPLFIQIVIDSLTRCQVFRTFGTNQIVDDD